MSAQVEDRHREAAMTALNSATREQHGEWHPEVAAVAQLLADTEAAAREQGAAVYSDSVDAERAGWVARVAELERERDEARGRAVGWRNAMRSLRNVVGEIAAVVQKGNHESTADAVRRALEAVDGAEESPAPEAQAGTTVAQEREEPVAAPRPVGADGIGVGKDSAITKLVDELIAERDALRSEVERLRAESAWVPCSERTPGPEGD